MSGASAAELEWVEKLLAGDEASFSRLVRAYHGQLLRVAQSFVSSEAVAEEVVQETWMAVLKGLSRFEGRSTLKTWIFRILTNRAKTRGVREGRSVPFSTIDADDAQSVPDQSRFTAKGGWASPVGHWPADAPEKLSLDKEARQVIEAAIKELPSNQAAVISLRDVQGWSSAEVCELLDVSEANQRVLLHRARTRVRNVVDVYLKGEG